MNSERVIGGVYILLVMAWAYLLTYAIVELTLRKVCEVILTYYKAKAGWLDDQFDALAKIIKEKEKE